MFIVTKAFISSDNFENCFFLSWKKKKSKLCFSNKHRFCPHLSLQRERVGSQGEGAVVGTCACLEGSVSFLSVECLDQDSLYDPDTHSRTCPAETNPAPGRPPPSPWGDRNEG